MTISAPLRLLFLGTRSAFSGAILQALQCANVEICALFIHSPAAPWQQDLHPRRAANFGFPHYAQSTPTEMSTPQAISLDLPAAPLPTAQRDAPVLTLGGGQAETPIYEIPSLRPPILLELIATLQPHVACVACFPKRIPAVLLNAVQHGFLNVHPSLLPAYRGPAPLFWIFRDGAQETAAGVTIHRMDANFDSGDMGAQVAVPLADGISGPAAEQQCVRKGGALLVQVLEDLCEGRLVFTPQPAGGSYQSWPRRQDFMLDRSWSARRAFNFMRGTAEWNTPYTLPVGEQLLHIGRALGYEPHQQQSVPVQRIDESTVRIQMAEGVLTASLAQIEQNLSYRQTI